MAVSNHPIGHLPSLGQRSSGLRILESIEGDLQLLVYFKIGHDYLQEIGWNGRGLKD
jgi:hypothetical protein